MACSRAGPEFGEARACVNETRSSMWSARYDGASIGARARSGTPGPNAWVPFYSAAKLTLALPVGHQLLGEKRKKKVE
ncbi:hypothetical protein MRX96_044454 [Rhipicephalus microplus]